MTFSPTGHRVGEMTVGPRPGYVDRLYRTARANPGEVTDVNAMTHPAGLEVSARRRRGRGWRLLAALEVAAALAAVLFDVLIPTLVVLAVLAVSLMIRREGFGSLGFRRADQPWRMAGQVFGLTVGWTLVQFGLVMPVLNHVTGRKQDLSDFSDVEGNLTALWSCSSPRGRWPRWARNWSTGDSSRPGSPTCSASPDSAYSPQFCSSVLFGLAHTEQGIIGVVLTFLDALFLSYLRLHFRNLWAPVLAHGFNNTIGLVTFFLVGPVYGLW